MFTGSANSLSIQPGATLTGGIVLSTPSTSVLFKQLYDYTLSNVISGAGSVSKFGAGTLTLTGTNTYTGGTTIYGGSLQIGDGGTSGSIVGNVNNRTTLIFNRSDATSFAGVISGTGAVIKNGAGTLTLTGANTHTGGTRINGGTLQIGDGGTIGSIVGDVDNRSTLVFNRSDATSFAGVIFGTGVVIKDGAGTLTLTGTNTYTGGTTIKGGKLSIGNGGTSGSIIGDVFNNATLIFNRSNDSDFASTISGTGNVIKDGAGTLTLTGTNTYTGGTRIDAGTLRIGNGGTSGSITGQVMNNGILSFERSDATSFGGVISGSGSVTKSGAGTLTLSGANSYTGGTTINGGALSIDADVNLGAASGGLTLNGGKLVTPTSFASGRAVSLGTGGGTFETASNTTFSLSGVISGSGTLTKMGSGSLTLTGANTYSGGTRIFGGTLRLGNATTSGSIIGDVLNDGTLLINRTDTTSFTGKISGSGDVIKAGTGTLTLTGANTYTGGTRIDRGTLTIGDGATSGSITGDVSNSGTLNFDRSDATSFAGAISGSGAVSKTGAGTLTLSGVNSYTGGTTVTGGTLSIADDANLGATSGAVTTSFTSARAVTLGAGGGALDTAAATAFFLTGVVSGAGGLSKAGAGTLKLSGTNTYTGPTTIDGGTLSVNGSIASSSSLTVNTGGTLGGSGTVGKTVISGGTLAPGNSIGTLAVNGTLSFTAGSTYAVEVSPSASDRVNVTGTATLGGAKVATSFQPGSYVAKQYTILKATGGLVGTLGQKIDSNLPSSFKSSLSYDGTHVFLDLALNFTPVEASGKGQGDSKGQDGSKAKPGAGAASATFVPTSPSATNRGLNPNQTSAANSLTTYFNRNGGIPMIFGGLTPQGLSQVAGEPVTGVQTNASAALTQFVRVLTDGLPGERGVSLAAGPAGFASYSSAKSSKTDRPARPVAITPDPDLWRWSVWGSGFGKVELYGANAVAGTAAATNRIYGAAVGADYRLATNTTLGLALGGGATNFNIYGLGSGSSDLFQAGLFLRQQLGASYFSASAAYAWQDVTTDRTLSASDHLQGRFNANSYAGRIEAGHRLNLAGFGITSYAAAQLTLLSLPGYHETAVTGPGTFALSFAGKDTTRLRSELGLKVDRQLTIAGLDLTLRTGAAWVANSNTKTSAMATFQTLPGASFLVKGAAPDRNALRTSAAAELKLSKALTLATAFEGEFASNSRSLSGKATLRYSW